MSTMTNAYELGLLLQEMTELDTLQPYTAKWNLAADPKLKEGTLYMASMNPREPACFQMLGVVCLMNRDRNLAVASFEKAIALGSPQKQMLKLHVDMLKNFMAESRNQAQWERVGIIVVFSLLAAVALLIIAVIRKVIILVK